MREMDTESPVVWPSWCYSGEGNEGDTPPSTQSLTPSSATSVTVGHQPVKSRGKRRCGAAYRMDQVLVNGTASSQQVSDYHNNNNNNNTVKNERLSPATSATPDNSSRSRSVTPSSSSIPGTPPGLEHVAASRNYSDFMRSLAAKYNNTNPNEYFNSPVRNGILDPRFGTTFKPGSPFASLISPLGAAAAAAAAANVVSNTTAHHHLQQTSVTKNVEDQHPAVQIKKQTEQLAFSAMFPPMIDMSSTQALLAMVRQAKEDELNSLMKGAKRPHVTDSSSPLDLSSAGGIPALKKACVRPPKSIKRGGSESPGPPSFAASAKLGSASPPNSAANMKTDTGTTTVVASTTTPRQCQGQCGGAASGEESEVAVWSVDDVVNFVSSIDICAEYAQNFREQSIDGAGLPLLTEEHLTSTINMKLGPALKLKAMLSRKLGSCAVCLHCAHCHGGSGSATGASDRGSTTASPPIDKRPSSNS